MSTSSSYRLDGFEPDNLLAFLALLGLLRSLEAHDGVSTEAVRVKPRISWDIDTPPLRPRLWLARDVAEDELLAVAARGAEMLALVHDFESRPDLDYSRQECWALLKREVEIHTVQDRGYLDLLAALMSDAAIKDEKEEGITPTPLCLLFGQGHQHFLERLANVPREPAPPPRGRGKKAIPVSATECIREAIFRPWHRNDPTSSFRWDPEEDVRYALMAGDPTDGAYKSGTQHGANRLAALGLPTLTLAPERRAGRVRPAILGGMSTAEGFSFAWPVWRERVTLEGIRSLLTHPDLRKPNALQHLGVESVFVANRISVGKFMNFGRARPSVQANVPERQVRRPTVPV